MSSQHLRWTGERIVPNDMHKAIDTYQQHLIRYVWALQFVRGKRVLDAACGCGYGTDLMATVAKEVTGVDISQEALWYASKHYNKSIYIIDDLNELKHPYLNIDTIVTFETIEHLDDPKKFLEWCKGNSKEVIGSIPVNCKTEFHKHVWGFHDIYHFLESCDFRKLTIWHQKGNNIFAAELNPDMILFRGVC